MATTTPNGDAERPRAPPDFVVLVAVGETDVVVTTPAINETVRHKQGIDSLDDLTRNSCRESRRMSFVVIGFNVRICKTKLHARRDGLDAERRIVRECVGQNITCGNFDGL